MMRADQGRIRDILKETILALLNNGVEFSSELEVDGLLGVTVDKKDVFLVKISEVVPSLKRNMGGGDSSDEEMNKGLNIASSSGAKFRRKRRSPSPKATSKGEKRQRVSSPTLANATPSSTSLGKGDGEDFAQVDIDLTSVKMEPVDTTVSDSNHSNADMSDVGPSFDYNQQQPHITSIQAVSQTADAEPQAGPWQVGKPGQMNQGLHGDGGWLDDEDYSGEEDEEDFEDDEAWEEAMMQQQHIMQQQAAAHMLQMQQQQQQQQQMQMGRGQGMMMRGAPGGQMQHQHKQKQQHMMEDHSESESESSEEEEKPKKSKKSKSAFDYYKSNPKHPDITKAIMEGSKAVLEKIIGMSAAKAKAGKKKEEKAKRRKERQSAGITNPIPFIKDTVDAQVVVKQEPIDAGDAELIVRPIPPTHSATVSSTSVGFTGRGSPQRTPMGPPPPPPPKDPSQDFLNYPAGPPLNTQFSPAALKSGSSSSSSSGGGAFKCDICPYSTNRPQALQKHRLKEHGEGDTEFSCPDCTLSFFSLKELQQHMKSAHKQAAPKGDVLMCDCHGKVFRSADSLAEHLKKVARDECLTCQTCGKLFVRKDALLNHIQSKHGGSQAAAGAASTSGMSAATATPPATVTTVTSDSSSASEQTAQCGMCDEDFSTEDALASHRKACTRSKLAIEKPDNFFCEDCQLEFPSEVDLKDHMKTQHKEVFTCDVCSKTYSSKKSLQAHVKKMHPGEVD